jgi:hypothetical protein
MRVRRDAGGRAARSAGRGACALSDERRAGRFTACGRPLGRDLKSHHPQGSHRHDRPSRVRTTEQAEVRRDAAQVGSGATSGNATGVSAAWRGRGCARRGGPQCLPPGTRSRPSKAHGGPLRRTRRRRRGRPHGARRPAGRLGLGLRRAGDPRGQLLGSCTAVHDRGLHRSLGSLLRHGHALVHCLLQDTRPSGACPGCIPRVLPAPCRCTGSTLRRAGRVPPGQVVGARAPIDA